MDLENQKVLVAGLGKSGMAAYELLKNMGAKVSLFDGKKDLDVSGFSWQNDKRGTCRFCLCGV